MRRDVGETESLMGNNNKKATTSQSSSNNSEESAEIWLIRAVSISYI